MINFPITILDNTACYFYSENNYFILGYALSGYKGFDSNQNGLVIPYLCKNQGRYEVGIGQIEYLNNDNKLILNRLKILSSSDNNNPVSFEENSNNALYCFANSYNFNRSLSSLIEVKENTELAPISATYLLDISEKNLNITLPDPTNNENIIIELKTSTGPYVVNIINGSNYYTTLYADSYIKLACTGSDWIVLVNPDNHSLLDNESATFGALGVAVGTSGSFQYNNGGDLGDSNVFVGGNNKVLLGSSEEALAHAILPTSGNYPTIFNNSRNASDFIVKGSGDKNLFFGYDGKLGINIPSGSRPQTSLHIINSLCQDSIRVENRNQCNPTNITLYHKPSTAIDSNSIIGTINLSCKNSTGNQADYAQLRGKAVSSNAVSTSGEFAVAVNKNGTLIEQLSINGDSAYLGINNTNNIRVNNSGIFLNGKVNLTNIKFSMPTTSGQILLVNNNGEIVLTDIMNSPIINILDGGTVVFTGVCSS